MGEEEEAEEEEAPNLKHVPRPSCEGGGVYTSALFDQGSVEVCAAECEVFFFCFFLCGKPTDFIPH